MLNLTYISLPCTESLTLLCVLLFFLDSMEREIELADFDPTSPTSQTALTPEKSNEAVETEQIEEQLERQITGASDGKRRSRWRLSAIVLALFVRSHSSRDPRAEKSRAPSLSCIITDFPLQQLSLFVAALDATIVATAAPTISADLASAAGYTWIGAAYLLANAAAGPIWAKLSDIWGRKLIILLALACFFASSAVCATAKTMEVLIIGRSFQGTAGGGLILLVHVCISDLFSLR